MPSVLPARLAGHGVDRSEIADPGLRAPLSHLHHSLRNHDDALDGEERLNSIARRLRSHLGELPSPHWPVEHRQARQLRDYLAAHAYQSVTLDQASAALGQSVGHLSRSFRATFATSPHAFVIGLRVEQARRLLLDGWPPAEAATLTGFCAQAHLHRHFHRHTGTTPGRYGRRGPGRSQTRTS